MPLIPAVEDILPAELRERLTEAGLEVRPRRDAPWVTDAELIRRSGVPEKIMRENIRMLDRDPRSGFPRKNKLFGDRRYWPAVVAYFDRVGGLVQVAPAGRRVA